MEGSELDDCNLLLYRDWDPAYLASIFDSDFNDNTDLWNNSMDDLEVVHVAKHGERYCPIVEDISMDDFELCSAVEQIESE